MLQLQTKKSLGSEIKVCERHGEYTAEMYPSFSGNRILYSTCPECEKERKAQEKIEEEERSIKRETAKFSYAGIPPRFLKAKFSGFEMVSKEATTALKKIKTYFEKFTEIKGKGTSLILCGRPGTGKTHLASALVIALIKSGQDCKYTTSYKIFSRLKATYDRNNAKETEKEVILELTGCDLLVIDEIGVQFGSETEKILFYQIINGRYDNILPTVLISNLNTDELKTFIGERCFDRLKEGSGVVISFGWDSYRK